MDLATLLGLIGGMAFIAMAMVLGGGITMYMDVPSIFIVFVGSLFVVMMKFNLGQFLGAAKVAVKAFMFKLEKPEELIERVVQLADAARKGGFLALEEAEITNPFLQKAVNMLVDGHEQGVVKAALEKDIELTAERQTEGARIFRALGDVAPAMGMIGTLIGLVAMLANMDDPKAIGPAMSIALLTTLYGAMLANMVALPIADKLELRMGEERLNRTLILDAIMSIQDGQNPRIMQGLLENYLADAKRLREE
ncbi:flagellar motor protein PomA [Zobellella denitrificans]|uniref:Flagellar motor protein PomA n=1 Tax=Zobellella denitrificans TaxID=347534 RepID=A0A291HRX1_9GAMM|nr:flagellar motor protein PomA [Zobellella denitrificans]ATG74811.1 flagellar motor protein PomA [Zobellella denitrificans]